MAKWHNLIENLAHLPTRITGIRVNLPKDERVKERFELKLTEYQLRYKIEGRETTHHKVAVVTELLTAGKIDERKLRQKLSGEPWFDEESYVRALEVIKDYAKTGGKNIRGGTGFLA